MKLIYLVFSSTLTLLLIQNEHGSGNVYHKTVYIIILAKHETFVCKTDRVNLLRHAVVVHPDLIAHPNDFNIVSFNVRRNLGEMIEVGVMFSTI